MGRQVLERTLDRNPFRFIRITADLLYTLDCGLSVEDCVYNMQLAEGLMEADLCNRADERSDSTATPHWELVLAMAQPAERDISADAYRRNKALNAPLMARRDKNTKAWQAANKPREAARKAKERNRDPEAYRAYAREYQRKRRARIAASRGEKHG